VKTAKGDLWKYPADWRIITTNGFVKKNGEAVMGRGTAWQAKTRYPELARRFGEFLNNRGNHVGIFEDIKLLTMPTKHHWIDDSDLLLIERSCVELASLPYQETFVLPTPGCGNGKLLWSEVKLIIEPILDDRFTVLV
jgi:hypothetical protein